SARTRPRIPHRCRGPEALACSLPLIPIAVRRPFRTLSVELSCVTSYPLVAPSLCLRWTPDVPFPDVLGAKAKHALSLAAVHAAPVASEPALALFDGRQILPQQFVGRLPHVARWGGDVENRVARRRSFETQPARLGCIPRIDVG